jgi:lactoylglutathione lyase
MFSLASKQIAALGRRSFSSRPFKVLGVQQIAIGCETRDPLNKLWRDVFGLQASSSHRMEKENVEEDILQLGPQPYAVEIDLMTPIDASKSPKVGKE